MSEETNDGGGKKKSPGKVLGILGLVFGLVGLICGIIAYMALPSPDDVTSGSMNVNDLGSAVGGGLSLLVGGFCAWVGIILAVIGLIIALIKKAESKGMVFIGLIVSILAYVVLYMATPSIPDTGDWEDKMEEAMDNLGH